MFAANHAFSRQVTEGTHRTEGTQLIEGTQITEGTQIREGTQITKGTQTTEANLPAVHIWVCLRPSCLDFVQSIIQAHALQQAIPTMFMSHVHSKPLCLQMTLMDMI